MEQQPRAAFSSFLADAETPPPNGMGAERPGQPGPLPVPDVHGITEGRVEGPEQAPPLQGFTPGKPAPLPGPNVPGTIEGLAKGPEQAAPLLDSAPGKPVPLPALNVSETIKGLVKGPEQAAPLLDSAPGKPVPLPVPNVLGTMVRSGFTGSIQIPGGTGESLTPDEFPPVEVDQEHSNDRPVSREARAPLSERVPFQPAGPLNRVIPALGLLHPAIVGMRAGQSPVEVGNLPLNPLAGDVQIMTRLPGFLGATQVGMSFEFQGSGTLSPGGFGADGSMQDQFRMGQQGQSQEGEQFFSHGRSTGSRSPAIPIGVPDSPNNSFMGELQGTMRPHGTGDRPPVLTPTPPQRLQLGVTLADHTRVQIDVTVRQGQVSANLIMDQVALRNLAIHNEPQLNAQLSSVDLELKQFGAEVSDQSAFRGGDSDEGDPEPQAIPRETAGQPEWEEISEVWNSELESGIHYVV
ncbi:MAG: hypothetical protein VST66_08715 [Nitrospirota bacterium]|nr:hypothetical protein [Nitrospirota bacterium]